jgi:peroxiredoxin Q/BCP
MSLLENFSEPQEAFIDPLNRHPFSKVSIASYLPFFLVFTRDLPMTDWIEPGEKAPSFTLPSKKSTKVKLTDFKGRYVVLYFYPRDDTPGCTKEACAFRDLNEDLQALDVVVLGVSTDDLASHEKFREKFSLNFPLLADTEHAVAEKYGAWREKNMYGKKSWGIQRSTYLIDPEGKVARVWKRVQVDGHADEVLKEVKSCQSKLS